MWDQSLQEVAIMTMGTPERPIELLLVEDNPGDAQLTREILKESKFVSNISLTEDGEQAWPS